MARRAANGFIAPKPSNYEFVVTEGREPEKTAYFPSGVFIHGDHHVGVFMNYAGLDDSAWSTFVLPTDPSFLREIANAISLMADHIEKAKRV